MSSARDQTGDLNAESVLLDQNSRHNYGSTSLYNETSLIQGTVINNYFCGIDHAGIHNEDLSLNLSGAARPDARASRRTNEVVANDSRPDKVGAEKDVTEKKDVLKELRYDKMDVKKDESMPGNLFDHDWIWSTSFPAWLTESDETYWVSGKAGSGKSTMIAYLAYHKRTLNSLERSGAKYKVIYYFFDYRGGNETNNSIYGMLRSFLYQLSDDFPHVKARLQILADTNRLNLDSTQQLVDVACESINMISSKVCAFVDGLDEYNGDVIELLRTCRSLVDRTGLKLCIASRPELGIPEGLDLYSKIVMQEHNEASMQTYTRLKILQAKATDIDIEKWLDEDTCQHIIENADGIILWFKLVFDEALAIRRTSGTRDDLLDFVYGLVPGLIPLYDRILDLIPPASHHEAALFLHIIQQMQDFGNIRLVDFSRNSSLSGFQSQSASPCLEVLLQIHDFLCQKFGSAIGLTPVKNIAELGSRIEFLLHGLVQIVETQATGLLTGKIHRLTFIHATFSIFLRDRGWVREHLHPWILENFPDEPVLRLGVHLFEQAAKEQFVPEPMFRECLLEVRHMMWAGKSFASGNWSEVARLASRFLKRLFTAHRSSFFAVWNQMALTDRMSRQMRLRDRFMHRLTGFCSVSFELAEPWRQRLETFLPLSACLLQLAAIVEEKDRSSLPIIGPAMQSYLAPWLAFEYIMQKHQIDRVAALLADPELAEITDLILALLANLPFYFCERLRDASLTHSQKKALGFMFMRQCGLPSWKLRCEFIADKFLEEQCLSSIALDSEDVCFFLRNLQCLRAGDNADDISYRLEAIQIPQTANIHHSSCKYKSKHGLLMDWAVLACKVADWQCEEGRLRVPHLKDLLGLVLKTGADINMPCYSRGTVLNAILDYDILATEHKQHHRDSLPGAKFLVLVNYGIKPSLASKNGTILETARRFRKQIEKDHKNKKHKDWAALMLMDIKLIIERLELYDQTGSWTHGEQESAAVDKAQDKTEASKDESSPVKEAEEVEVDDDPGLGSSLGASTIVAPGSPGKEKEVQNISQSP